VLHPPCDTFASKIKEDAMFFFYAGRTYTAKVHTTAIRTPTCENCGESFSYAHLAEGQGVGDSPYFLDDEGGAQRAREGANRALRYEIKHGVSIRPCPKCGWYQKEMVRALRQSRALSAAFGAWIAVMGLLLLWVSISAAPTRFSTTRIVLTSAVLGLGLLIFYWRMRSPNWGAANRERWRKFKKSPIAADTVAPSR
jgi:hypothetical protein